MELSYKNLSQVLEERAKQNPDQLAFIFLQDGEKTELPLSYQELDKAARIVAARLQEVTKPGQRVLILYPPGLDFIIGLYGCLYAGVIAVPLFPPEPAKLAQTLPRLLATAKDAQAEIILTNQMVLSFSEYLFQMSPELKKFQWLPTDVPPASEEKINIYESKPEDIALLMYTSGSTGNPKGVMLSHSNLLHQFKLLVDRYAGDPSADKGVGWGPPYHISGLVLGVLLPIYTRTCTVLMSPLDFLAKPFRWLKAITHYQAVFSGAPNFAYDLCVQKISPEEKSQLDLRSWKMALNGSEPIRADTLKRFSKAFESVGFCKEAFLTAYGLTESGLMIAEGAMTEAPKLLNVKASALEKKQVVEAKEQDRDIRTLVSSGEILEDTEVRIVDPEKCIPCDPSQVGEVWASSPCVAVGYWNRPEEGRQTFGARLATGEGPYLRTGDLGFINEGNLYLTGRIKEMIIIRGINFYPQDIEITVEQSHPAVNQQMNAAFSIETSGGEGLVVVSESKSLEKNQYEEVIGKIREAISHAYQIQPHAIILVGMDTLPRTVTRKIQRGACKQAYLSGSLETLWEWRQNAENKIKTKEETAKILPKNEKELEAWLLSTLSNHYQIDPKKLDLQKSLPSYGLDSLGAVQLSTQIESDLNIAVPITELFEATSLQQLLVRMTDQWRSRSKTGAFRKAKPDLHAEAVLDPTITVTAQKPKLTEEVESIFLTGATGFLGAFFLHELLLQTRAKIYCLVRASSEAKGRERIQENLDFFSLWDPAFSSRVIPILGDLSRLYFGLSEIAFDELANQVDVIYHNGAAVNFIYSYWDLKPSNVLGTQEVIRLAGKNKLKPLHYVSTLSVFPIGGDSLSTVFSEENIPEIETGLLNGYAQSKWVAERLVREAGAKGVPVSIYRVGEVMGHSETGICRAKHDAYSNIIKGSVLLGSAPELQMNLYIVPVDFAVKAIYSLAQKKSSLGKTFHITGTAMPGLKFFDIMKNSGYSLRLLPYDEWIQELEQLSKKLPKNPLAPLMPFLTSEVIQDLSKGKSLLNLDNRATLQTLAGSAFACPAADKIFTTHLNYLRRSGFMSLDGKIS